MVRIGNSTSRSCSVNIDRTIECWNRWSILVFVMWSIQINRRNCFLFINILLMKWILQTHFFFPFQKVSMAYCIILFFSVIKIYQSCNFSINFSTHSFLHTSAVPMIGVHVCSDKPWQHWWLFIIPQLVVVLVCFILISRPWPYWQRWWWWCERRMILAVWNLYHFLAFSHNTFWRNNP